MRKIEYLLEVYRDACNALLKEFCDKNGFNYKDAKEGWCLGNVGGVVCCGDYFFDMDVIVTDLTENTHGDELIKWYDYQMRCGFLGIPSCNYRSWLKRCPVHSEEYLSKLEDAKKRVEVAENELNDLIRNGDSNF